MLSRLGRLSGVQIVLLCAVLIAAYFLATAGMNLIRAHQLGQQEDRLRLEIAEMQARHERLVALEHYLNSDEYVEAIAREQLGLVKEGETAFIAISTQPTPTPAAGSGELWWEVLIR